VLRVLCLTIGPEAEPSSRFRVYQYRDALRALGVSLEVRPRVGRRYFEMGYGLRRPPAALRAAWVGASAVSRRLRRLRDLRDAGHFDALLLQKETLPPGGLALLRAAGVPVVYDVDDAIWEPQTAVDGLGPRLRRVADGLARRPRVLPELLAHCHTVLAGSPALAEYARRFAPRVEILPTVVDTDAYPVSPRRRRGTLTVGWIGAPANAVYLEPLRPVFREITRRFDCRVLLLGPHAFECPGARVEVRPFQSYASRDEEAAALRDLDVGLLPLPDDRFARGKCGLKAIQYMACGLPVVASPVGVTPEILGDGACGLLASTPGEWRDALAHLLADPGLRERLGRAGRARAEARYSLRAAAPRLAAALRAAAGSADSASRAPSGRAGSTAPVSAAASTRVLPSSTRSVITRFPRSGRRAKFASGRYWKDST